MGDKKQRKRERRLKRLTKKNRDRTPEQSTGPVFLSSPFNEIPPDTLRKAAVEFAKESRVKLKNYFAEVLGLLRSVEPFQTLSLLAFYGLYGSINDRGDRSSFLPKKLQFLQPNVELAQALLLTIPPSEVGSDVISHESLQKLFEILPSLSNAFAYQRMLVAEQERSPEEKSIGMLQEALRAHTQTVRNWGYFDDVVRTIKSLYSPLDAAFISHVGLSATQIVDGFVALIRSSERSFDDHSQKLAAVFRQPTSAEMIRKYYELNPGWTEPPDKMIQVIQERHLDREQTKRLIFSHVEYRFPSSFEFSASTFAVYAHAAESNARYFLEHVSLCPGELASVDPEHLLLDNPVWKKPVIKFGEDRYFCAMPQVFFSFALQIMRELSKSNADLEVACQERRAEYLEDSISSLFREAFPAATFVRSFKWQDGNQRFENDLIVKLDSHLFLIEAKSGSVTPAALRGAANRAKKHIDDLIIAPSVQSARLAERIRQALGTPLQYSPELAPLKLDDVRTVFRLSITLEDFATIQSNLHHLDGTGWLPAGHTIAPCILLGDLQTIFEILGSNGHRINYLRRRTELASTLTTMGDELDHLGLYLMNGFNMAEAEAKRLNLVLSGMSAEIDKFCMARAEGIRIPKPKPRMGNWWEKICETVEKRRFPRWTDTFYVLLSLSPEEQERAEGMFRKAKRNVLSNVGGGITNDSVVIIPPNQHTNAIGLRALRYADFKQRHALMRAVADNAFDHEHVKKCLVITVFVDRDVEPYSSLGMYFRDDSNSTNVDDLLFY